jgi:hypothetical protein
VPACDQLQESSLIMYGSTMPSELNVAAEIVK